MVMISYSFVGEQEDKETLDRPGLWSGSILSHDIKEHVIIPSAYKCAPHLKFLYA